jgi:hypothetical protein
MITFKFFRGHPYNGEVTLPMISRVVSAGLISQDLVPVQPMQRQPDQRLFHLNYIIQDGEIIENINSTLIPTQELTIERIRNSPFLRSVYRQGREYRRRNITEPPMEYNVSNIAMTAWRMGYNEI